MNRINFTKIAIENLPPALPGKRVEYWDTKQPGLQIRVTETGSKTFYVKRRVKNGEVERIMLGRFPGLPVERARADAAQYVAELASGNSPVEAARAIKGELTFAELFDLYLERHAKLKKRTWKEDEQKYRDYLARPLGKKKISSIERKDLAEIHSRITIGGHPTLANRVKDLMSSIFGRAVNWGLLEENPARGIEDNKEQSRERFLKPGELPRIFQALADEPNTSFRDFFLLALLTGARRSNLRTMRWADIDLDDSIWRIPGAFSKNGQSLHVPLVPESVKIIKARRESIAKDCPYVFPTSRKNSKYGHLSGERKAWLRILGRAEIAQIRERCESAGKGLEEISGETTDKTLKRAKEFAASKKVAIDGTDSLADITIHDLRRTLGSWQARTGASMVVIGKSLGHKSQQATAVYARLDLDPVRQAMEAATNAMLETGGLKNPAEVKKLRKSQ